MARVVSLFLPLWPTERLQRQEGTALPAEVPLTLAAREGGRRMVTAANAAAQAFGLRAGMTVARAQAMVPGLMVRPATPEADCASLERLALWLLQRVAPVVAVDGADGIVIDVTGAAHLHGGEEALLSGLVGRLAMSGVTTRAAVADTWGAAHALARFGAEPVFIVPPGEVAMHLESLPLAALRLPREVAAGLHGLGFARVGDLIGQPRAPLTRRFGAGLCLRLDQALGLAAEPVAPIRPEEPVSARRLLAEPIAAPETIARHVGKLVVMLCKGLEGRGLGVRRLDLVCRRTDGRAQVVRAGLSRPTRDVAHLTRLLCARIETIAPGFGIEAVELTASRAEPLPARQIVAPLVERPAPDLSALVDTLANRVGAHQVYRFAPVASDVPERSVRRVPVLVEEGGMAGRRPGASNVGPGGSGRPPRHLSRPGDRPGDDRGPLPADTVAFPSRHALPSPPSVALDAPAITATVWPIHWPRPARLLPRPEPIETMALLPDHPPVRFIWRGRRHAIVRADGPERIFGEWWARAAERAAVRDYFRVEDATGARFWVFRAGDGEDAATGTQRWFLHGLFG